MRQAIEFIKKHGFEYATDVVNENKGKLKIFSTFEMDLKRLVESHELVERLGGLDLAKAERAFRKIRNILQSYDSELAQAIADVESCQGEVS